MENHEYFQCCEDSSYCNMKPKNVSRNPESDNVICHENKLLDLAHDSFHEDVDVTGDWVKHTSAGNMEKQAVQCTDDQVLTKEDSLCETSEISQVQLQVIDEDIDLPHCESDSTERNPSGDGSLKVPRLICWPGNSSETLIDEKALSLNCIHEGLTSKKLPTPVDHDQEDVSPLNIHNYLKQPRHQSFVQNVQVCMLSSATQNQIQVPVTNVSNKTKNRPSQSQNIYNEEMNRLATYYEYPADLPVFAITLAGDGFIFLPEKEAIECNFCSLQINLSELKTQGVNPVKIHWDKSPQCPLKQGRDCGNIPVKKFDEISAGPAVQSTSSDNSSSETSRPHLADIERSQSTVAGLSDGAVLQPSPVIHHQPALDLTAPDSAPLVQQDLAHTPSAVQRNSVTRPPESNPPSTTAATSQPQSGPASQGPRNSVSRNETSNPAPASSQKGASAPAANSSQSKNSKSNKKSKSAKKSASASSANGPNESAQASSSRENQSTGDKSEPKEKKKLTYADLGIFADKPKRADMGVLQKRLSTFEGKWKDSFVKTPQMLAECGMYYAGYADCARCFFCGGGLKNWEAPDEPWIEHARWFPKCAYIRLCKGPMFVDIVQRKNKDGEKIYLKDVEDEMALKSESENMNKIMARQPVAVSTGQSGESPPSSASFTDLAELEAENEELTSQVTCKICMDEKSSVVFLPCGHMVACTNCAIILKSCPLCRAEIKGSVKAHMD